MNLRLFHLKVPDAFSSFSSTLGCGNRLFAPAGVHTVKASSHAVGRRRDAEVNLPSRRHQESSSLILGWLVPRTTESSTSNDRCLLISARSRLELQAARPLLTDSVRSARMKGPAMYWFAYDSPSNRGIPDSRLNRWLPECALVWHGSKIRVDG